MSKIDFSNHALSNIIAERIAEQIITGELEPGEKLIEQTYADEYGTSRAPVREALYLLSIEGLVERIPRKGSIVKEYAKTEIYDLLEIRILLESMSMNRIKENGVDFSILNNMEKIFQEMQDEKDVNNYTQLNHAFHLCLIKMSKSRVIENMYNRIKLPLTTLQSLTFTNEQHIDTSVSEHRIIVEHLKSDRVVEATDLLNKHNQNLISNVLQRLKKEDGL